MYFSSLRHSSMAHVMTRTSGAWSLRCARPSGQQTTFAKTMRSSGTPAARSTRTAVSAEPPVASIGSQSRTCSSVTRGGSLEYSSVGSAVASSRWMSILAVLAVGARRRTASRRMPPERMISTMHSSEPSSVRTPSNHPHGDNTRTSTTGIVASASSASKWQRRSAACTKAAWVDALSRSVVSRPRTAAPRRTTTPGGSMKPERSRETRHKTTTYR
mmetsp:Transcript_14791/g.51428  ORF Transcript_14791/g.51428 Transcript_14791/m.51428 type:complete len:216 (-) Transcript_14791:2-649(-)